MYDHIQLKTKGDILEYIAAFSNANFEKLTDSGLPNFQDHT